MKKIEVPSVGESVAEVEIGAWHKAVGERVEQDEDLVSLETDKASVELPAPAAGVLAEIQHEEGDSVKVGSVIGLIDDEGGGEDSEGDESRDRRARGGREDGEARAKPDAAEEQDKEQYEEQRKEGENEEEKPSARHRERETEEDRREEDRVPDTEEDRDDEDREQGVEEDRDDEDREQGVEEDRDDEGREKRARKEDRKTDEKGNGKRPRHERPSEEDEDVEVVPLSRLRRAIAKRLVAAQREAALLTTFQEIDLSRVQALRAEHGEAFADRHGVRLGVVSFFVPAVVAALRATPNLNARVDGDDVVRHRRFHVGIAVGGGEGLVVPVLRDADRLSLAEIEAALDDFAARAKNGTLEASELAGGTFTITNGGVYGSLLSTPIVNPPESGILGLHAIEDRPVAVEGEVEVRAMMYVALTYDHRLIDGREAVGFLRRVKELVEEPVRLLLDA